MRSGFPADSVAPKPPSSAPARPPEAAATVEAAASKPARQAPEKPPVDARDVELRYSPEGQKQFMSLGEKQRRDEMFEARRDEAQALDPALSEAHRALALGRLAERGALSPQMADLLARTLQGSAQQAVRLRLCEAVKGRLDRPELVEALISRVLSDPSEAVRARAGETLAARREDPRVREVLERARQVDGSKFVRDNIRRALETAPRN